MRLLPTIHEMPPTILPPPEPTAMSDERREVEFEKLNFLGKTVYLTGAASRMAAGVLDSALHRAADLAVDTERAFRQGLDDSVEDAKIIAERRRDEDADQ